MELFKKKLTIIYIEDRVSYIGHYEEQGQVEELRTFDIPANVVEDGRILDASQLQYLIKKEMEGTSLSKGECVFVVNTTEAVNRALHVPSMTNNEIASLVENERDNLFAQDPEAYQLEYKDLGGEDDLHHLLITIAHKALLEEYRELAKSCGLKLVSILPFSTLAIAYAHWLGGGRIASIASSHLGFYYAHENRYYGRCEVNTAMQRVLSSYDLQYSEIKRVYLGQYEERLIDIDRENLQREVQSSIYESLSYIENMGGDFALEERQLLCGALVENGIYDLVTSNATYSPLSLREIFSVANEHRDDIYFFNKEESHWQFRKSYILPAIVVVCAFGVLLGTFFYGEKIKQENRELIVQTEQQESAQKGVYDGKGAEQQEDIAAIFSTIKSDVPDSLTVTSMDYNGGSIEISGEGSDESAIDAWRSSLEERLNKTVQAEPTASIGNIIYFRFTVNLSNTAQESGEYDEDTQTPSGEGIADGNIEQNTFNSPEEQSI